MTERLSEGLEIAEACEVRCVTVPPRAGEQALIEVLTALNEAETARKTQLGQKECCQWCMLGH